jgi:hypothetical protein
LVVKDVFQASDLGIRVLSDSEIDNKGALRVVSGIRCAPLHYPLGIEGGFVGVGGQQVYEVTQFYVQLTEPKPGVTQFRVLRRSARHFSRNLELRSIDQPPNAKRIAAIIKDRVAAALSSPRNVR